MKIIIIHYAEIGKFPPIRSLIQNLIENGHKVCVITFDKYDVLDEFSDTTLIKHVLPSIDPTTPWLIRMPYRFFVRAKIRKTTKQFSNEFDIIWTTNDRSVREVGKRIFLYKYHIMQLLELIDIVPAFGKQKLIRFKIEKYAQRAYKVVVPEVNRAYIQKAWWNLEELPSVLPNKLYKLDNTNEHINNEIVKTIQMMESESRIIVLYSGVFDFKERPLEAVASAIDKHKDKYVFYIMGIDGIGEKQNREKFCSVHNNLVYIPFIQPPYHLEITKRASIGLLSYVPNKSINTPLNAAYCAPCKIFDYAAFGLPMIGTDVPGITYPFERYGIGEVYRHQNDIDVFEALEKIRCNYENMCKNAKDFYDSIDLDEIVNEILN